MHLLDDAVTQVLHQIFDRMPAVPDSMIIGNAQDRHMSELQRWGVGQSPRKESYR